MNDLLKYMLSGILGNDDFSIEEETAEHKTNYNIKLNKDLVGKIIGKGGKTIKSIRNVVKVKATLEKKSVFVNISENS